MGILDERLSEDMSEREMKIFIQDQEDNLKSEWEAAIDGILEDEGITNEEHGNLQGFIDRVVKSPNF